MDGIARLLGEVMDHLASRTSGRITITIDVGEFRSGERNTLRGDRVSVGDGCSAERSSRNELTGTDLPVGASEVLGTSGVSGSESVGNRLVGVGQAVPPAFGEVAESSSLRGGSGDRATCARPSTLPRSVSASSGSSGSLPRGDQVDRLREDGRARGASQSERIVAGSRVPGVTVASSLNLGGQVRSGRSSVYAAGTGGVPGEQGEISDLRVPVIVKDPVPEDPVSRRESMNLLMNHGVVFKVARRLCRQYTVSRINEVLGGMEESQSTIVNRAGYLVRGLGMGWFKGWQGEQGDV